ncbi:methionine import ATP-binding protein MetN [Fructilactobacillus fructivorans]|uniref:methionine ABC transporter ATP-binding protein n=1 Tax=Fructilactobacillus fructivorans TaxID=1614 RepID=UPI000704D8B9|nr:methionine ABC transporter ATP-binding protein [Fructilactobacillus fructivorans]KRN12963.1 methionine import ATP-binding protein MetN [Fructilactobacillus fructivorans]
MSNNIVQFKDVSVTFKQKKNVIHAVSDVTLGIPKGEIFGIAGYSGAGKSTLVRTINLLQKPTDGEVDVFGKTFYKKEGDHVSSISTKDLRDERRQIGMIFQHFNLLEEQNVQRNVEFGLKHSGLKEKEREAKAKKMLDIVGSGDYLKAYPSQLSGGQQQRVAIARALANDPKILISDEATSALDPKNTDQILDLLKELNEKYGLTIILITHEMEAIKRICQQVAIMSDGKVVDVGDLLEIFVDSKNPTTRKIVGNSFNALEILKSMNIDVNKRNLIQLTYLSADINDPIIVSLYEKFHISASIIYSNIEKLGEQVVGTLIVDLLGGKEDQEAAVKYLEGQNIKVTELKEAE